MPLGLPQLPFDRVLNNIPRGGKVCPHMARVWNVPIKPCRVRAVQWPCAAIATRLRRADGDQHSAGVCAAFGVHGLRCAEPDAQAGSGRAGELHPSSCVRRPLALRDSAAR